MLKVNVVVTLKKSILDPQGNAVEKALRSMGYPVEEVRIGKFMEVVLPDEARENAVQILDEVCYKLLANPVIEEYHFEFVEEKPEAESRNVKALGGQA